MSTARPARLLYLWLALLVCGAAADRMVERAEVTPQHARVQTMVVVHGGRVVGVVQRVQLGRRFGPPELPTGTPDPAAECGQPQGGLPGLLDWAGCLVRCMRARRESAPPHMAAQMGAQMEMVRMQLARAAAAAGVDQPAGAAMPGFPGTAQPMPMPVPWVRVRASGAAPGSQPQPRWQWDENMPVPAAQQEPMDEDMIDSATAQQQFGEEPAAASAAAEPEPRAAPWWWPMGHMRRPARGAAAGGEEAAEAGGCHCKHCGCHHGGKHHHHHHHSHGGEEDGATLPLRMAMWHDLEQQREQHIVEQQRAHRAARPGNGHKLLPGVGTPVELIARERAHGYYARAWSELQAAQQRPAHGSVNWRLWDASGHLNWGLATFVALAVACAGVWSALLAQYALYRSARANNNAAEVLAAHYYSHMPSDDECVEGKGASSKDADLKPLLREGPVKGAIAAVHDGQL